MWLDGMVSLCDGVSVSGRSMRGILVGEVEGVSLKGVEDCVSSSNSKFEMLDIGLMLGTSGGLVILDGIGVRLLIGSMVNGSIHVKRPELSLTCP